MMIADESRWGRVWICYEYVMNMLWICYEYVMNNRLLSHIRNH